MTKHGKVAFITTPRFRESRGDEVEDFVYSHLYELCDPFRVMTTGRTGGLLLKIISRQPRQGERDKIRTSMGLAKLTEHDLDRWRSTITDALIVTLERFQGMIHVAYELVEGRLDAVIHFSDWEDKSAKPDSAVLSREANVHNVPLATDPCTALAHLRS